jgi:phosphatidylserine/phosphatidylglycerophosphate/cardiolipin synthase-like enzyme
MADAILVDNAIREHTLEMIRNARHSLYIEQMTLSDPDILDEIIAKGNAGLEIRILLDRWQYENEATMSQLKNNNISAQYYPTEKGQFHRLKFIIADSQTVLFASAPWTQSHDSYSALAFVMSGDTVQKALDLFGRDWYYTTTLELNLHKNIYDTEKITLTSTVGIKNLLLSHIEGAQQTIQITTQQLSGDIDILNALIAARQRGCQVSILLDSSCWSNTPNTIKALSDAAIEYRFFDTQDKVLFRNFGVFDSQRLVYTSSAWVYNTFVINHEGALAIPSPAAAQKCAELFQADWENAVLGY